MKKDRLIREAEKEEKKVKFDKDRSLKDSLAKEAYDLWLEMKVIIVIESSFKNLFSTRRNSSQIALLTKYWITMSKQRSAGLFLGSRLLQLSPGNSSGQVTDVELSTSP